MNNNNHKRVLSDQPFLRWAGGKRDLVPSILDLIPPDIRTRTYWEPFLGSGSLFFALKPSRAVLSDLNEDLIFCFKAVREHPKLVSRYLREHLTLSSKDYYYEVRKKYNRSKESIAKAAMFIYLNKTCFNGIWRVNTKGEFNVPYGFKDPPPLPSSCQLMALSEVLKNTKLKGGDFRKVLKGARNGDFVYLDPPYPPLNGTAYFTHYTKKRFGREDQMAVAETAHLLHQRGCRVLISNADTEFIRSLYEGFNIQALGVTRWLRTDGKRYEASEILIYNFTRPA